MTTLRSAEYEFALQEARPSAFVQARRQGFATWKRDWRSGIKALERYKKKCGTLNVLSHMQRHDGRQPAL